MVKITVQHRSSSKAGGKPSKPPVDIDFPHRHPNKVTVLELKGALEAKFPRLIPARQRITLDKTAFTDDDKTLDDYGVKEGDSLFVKDLGRQISWRTVFLVEYAGPLVIHPLFYFFGQQIYGGLARIAGERLVPFEHSNMQKVALALVLLHFAKREYETIFIHRFSNATMPFFNLFKNSAHYHLLSGLLLSFGIYGPWNSAPKLASSIRSSPVWLGAWSAFILFAIASNLHTHLTLRSLRPAGTKKRSIPKGYGFNLVFCANYLFEALEWFAFTAMTGSVSAGIFTALSVGQMIVWALKKQRAYKKDFGKDYPRGRKAIFPFLL